eukprot:CCRYP_002341-RD/>CCRYP_002341-RD protein AED:0.11 eAED:0.11 QI:152/1/1/1/0.88/0.94/18/731/1289
MASKIPNDGQPEQHLDRVPDGASNGLLGQRESLLRSLLASNSAERTAELERSPAKKIRETVEALEDPDISVEVRIKNGGYSVSTNSSESGKGIETVASCGTLTGMIRKFVRMLTCACDGKKEEHETKVIMEGVNLLLEEGKMYLVLGAPGCGKSTLLKMIANLLPTSSGSSITGSVSVNGVHPDDPSVVWSNVVSYVDQIDRLHGYLTVKETLEFAYQCRLGGTHSGPRIKDPDSASTKEVIAQLDQEGFMVDTVLEVVGLKRVADTFVGNDAVRGVSGGQRKRVTVGEMMCVSSQVQMYDEISTGLDASTTFEIVKLLGYVNRMKKSIKLVSLLQPPPETVALFDEIILLDKGRVLYAGPVENVTSHFNSLGYNQPSHMDLADWLQSLPTKDGANFLSPTEEGDSPRVHLTNEEFVQKFNASDHGKATLAKLENPVSSKKISFLQHKMFRQRYANSWSRYIVLIFRREFLFWWRDKYQIKARILQDLVMGIIVGTVFWQTSDPQTAMGVIFQSVFFISSGAMLMVGPQIETRGVFYKEQDANFYPTWTFVFARALSSLPTAILDALVYGCVVYWFAGFAATPENFFVFLLLALLAALSGGLMYSIFSGIVHDRTRAQAVMSISIVVMVLFSGFTVQPDVIPVYYIWIYWMNMFAWVIRALAINEFRSPEYDDVIADDGTTSGEAILSQFGFALNGEPLEYVWVWYTLLFCIGVCIFSVIVSVICLNHVRFATGKAASGGSLEVNEKEATSSPTHVSLPVKGATLTFKDVHYTVTASTSREKLELLKGVTGFFTAGKMTALMGSSGAGKTTLMDVLSLRKHSGEISGEIYLNGYPLEPDAFRRCTGYVEQFDKQSPQLTIRETVEFSAMMRLDQSIAVETKQKFVDQVLAMLELDSEAHLLVGSDSTGGLSFEQKKRLSIAVELAANPSIIFLDEPTSGLDARAASIVMRSMRRIANTGIAVVATIHQPSIDIFNSFDNLLLLKAGGETVFFGDLGNESCKLIEYLEGYESTNKIKIGENPATWMLNCIGAGGGSIADEFDYARAYARSSLAKQCLERIDEYNANPDNSNRIIFPTKYATSANFQRVAVYRKLSKIYWRSPGYNRVRLLVSAVVALLFGTVFASQRVPENEGDMNSRVTSIYITALFLAVNAQNTAVPVFEMERNMFYRHKAALMYDQSAISLAFFLCELPFIALASLVFCCLWYFTVGFIVEAGKFFWYYLFMTLSLATYTFAGQALISVLRDDVTAQGVGSIFIGLSSIFAGVLIRPQMINNIWIWAYWLFPLHYVL